MAEGKLTKEQAELRLLENIGASGTVYAERTPLIESLVERGLIDPMGLGHRLDRYSITEAGRAALQLQGGSEQ